MGEFSLSHLLIITVILLLVFGPSRLPALGQSLGKAIRGFKEGLNEMNAEVKDVTPGSSAQAQSQPAQSVHSQAAAEPKTESKS